MNDIFEKLVDKTAAMASVDKASIPLSKGRLKRWKSLSVFWYSNHKIFGDIFFVVIMHIASGRYPGGSIKLKPVVDFIEEAILHDPDALRVWKDDRDFKEAFDDVESHMFYKCHKNAIGSFIGFRLRSLTIYREEFHKPIDLASATRKEIHKAREIARCIRRYENFEKMILMFIPDATTWSVCEWTSEKHILDAFKTVHGIDFSEDPDSFTAFVKMMHCKLNGRSYFRYLFRIKYIPDSIAVIIWPTNIVKELSRQFLYASNAEPLMEDGSYLPDKDSVAPSVVKESWVYKTLESCRKTHTLSRAVKNNLLYFGWGDHPYIVRAKQRKSAADAIKSA